MIRSCCIPPVLSRICDHGVHSALLITVDGELLGINPDHNIPEPDDFSTLLADAAVDYLRLGQELGADNKLKVLLLEMEQGMVAVAHELGYFVVAVASPETPPGSIKAKVQVLAAHVQEVFSTLEEGN